MKNRGEDNSANLRGFAGKAESTFAWMCDGILQQVSGLGVGYLLCSFAKTDVRICYVAVI